MVGPKRPQKNETIEQINAQYGKLPPQAVEVEEAVIGALMLEADAIHRVLDVIDTPSFYKDSHQKIFDVIKKLSSERKPIDLLTVTQELRNRGELEAVGGPMEITKLTRRVASVAHVEFHARIIAQKFIQRELIRVSTEIQVDSYDDQQDLEELLSGARSKIGDIDSLILGSCSGQMSQVVAEDALKELEKDCVATKSGKTPGISTGFYDLDDALGGWRNTNLIILAARPSVGKSSLALHFALTAAMNGVWVNFYGLEMKNHDYFRILLSGMTGIDRTSIRDGRLTDDDWKKINEATSILRDLPILWSDNPSLTANHVRNQTIRNKKAGRCGLVIIDYLQLLKPTDKKAIREQQIAEMTRTLKESAMIDDVPVIALSQLNRDIEKRSDKEPTLADLRESGAIEQDADVVLFLWDKDEPKLKIGKNRRGKTGPIDFWANDQKTAFGDRPPMTEFEKLPELNFEENQKSTPF